MDLKAEMIQRIKNKGQPLQPKIPVQEIPKLEKRPLPTPFEFTKRVSNFKSLIKDVKEKKVRFNLKSVPTAENAQIHHNVETIMAKHNTTCENLLVNEKPIEETDEELSFAERQMLWNPKKKKKMDEESEGEFEEEEGKKAIESKEEEEEEEEEEETGGLSPGWETDKDLLPKEPNFKAAKMRKLFESQGLTSIALELLTREAEDVEKKLMKDFQDSQECIVSSKRPRDEIDE
jgi:hypothetical protein